MSKPKPQGRLLGSEAHEAFRQLDGELWLAQRLLQHGVDVFDGDTNRPLRRDRMRAAILGNGIARVVVGRKEGKTLNYADAFERLYGEPLEAPAPKSKRAKEGA